MRSLKDFLEEYCFWIYINSNDTFYYASADATQVEIYDLPKLREMEEKYGIDGVNAFCAVLRKEDVLKELQNRKYKKAKKEMENYKFWERDVETKEEIQNYLDNFKKMKN